ncbi:formin-1 isoform X6 [Ictidomys tridecemlineatus]
MEGTCCTLQLRKPITELCYISFYLPRGDIRGFSYKGTVTLDRASKGFQNCYQVREGPDIISLSQQPNEHPGDIFFKQTPTKDILTELYKLTAERERLLANLLSSDHILGISTGNQEGKLLELSVSLAQEDDCFPSAGDWSGEQPVGPLSKRSTHGNKQPLRFGGWRESLEALPQKRARRKGRGGREPAPWMGKDQICSSNSFPLSPARPNLQLLEERGNLVPNRALTSSLQRREHCPADIPRTPDSDLGIETSGTASEATGLGRGALPPDSSSTEAGNGGTGGPLSSPGGLERQPGNLDAEKRPEAEVGRMGKSAGQTRRTKPVSKVVAKVQDLSSQVQRVVKMDPEAEESIGICPEAQAEFISKADLLKLPGPEVGAPGSRWWGEGQQGDKSSQSLARETASISSSLASAEGAVNKVLLKVIESEKLDEATEGKRLGFPLHTRTTSTLPETRSKRRAGLSQRGRRSLLLDPQGVVGPDSSQPRDVDKRPSPPAPAALGMVFNNSSPQSSACKRTSPVPSPLPPRRTSPQQHHRILRLPPLPGEREAALNDSPDRKSCVFSVSPSADTLESPSSAKVTETKGASPTSFRTGPSPLVPGEPPEKSWGPGKTTAQAQHQSPPEYQAAILHLKREHKEEIENLQIIKLLDGKRSQTVGILISSLHLEMKDIQQAIFNVDDSVVDLETLAALYENRGQEDELVKIRKYYETSKEEELKLLDKPEQFLHELAQIPNFAERAQCIIFRSVFSEGITSLHRKVEIVTRASKGLLHMKSVKDILGLILAFGNYMNGGNRTRGQADGYSLEILPKLKDVKSRDNGINLVDYVVKYYLRYYDQEAGTEKSVFPLPEPQDFFLASQVKFEDLIKDLRKLKRQLEASEKQMMVVCKESPKEYLQPFKDKLEEFFQKAKKEHKMEESHLENAQKSFETTVGYFGMKPKAGEKEITPGYVFMVWYEFCSDFKAIWKRESKNISKERLKMAQASVSKLTSEKKVETKKINPTASLKERLRQKEASVTTN